MSRLRLGLPGGLDRLVRRILEDAGRARPVLLLDGGSGAGKTSLARRLAAELAEAGTAGVQVLSLDDIYPGWDGLAQAAALLPGLLAGEHPTYRQWDWRRDRPGARREVDPRAPLLVEGCGALTPASAALASTSMWLAMAPSRRKRLALARDGDGYAPHWQRWAAQERRHWREDHPRELADVQLHWLSTDGWH